MGHRISLPRFSAQQVRQCALFQGASEKTLRVLLKTARLRSVAKGEFVFHEGAPATSVYLLLSGRVKLVQLTVDGQQTIVHVVESGEPFGYPALFGGTAQRVAAEAIQDSVAVAWHVSVVMRIVTGDRVVTVDALRLLAGRLQREWDHVRTLRAKYVERRVARGMLQLIRDCECSNADATAVLELSHEDLADFVGTNAHTVSRVLGLWRRQGTVEVRRNRVLVRDPRALGVIADDLPLSYREPAIVTFEPRHPKRSS